MFSRHKYAKDKLASQHPSVTQIETDCKGLALSRMLNKSQGRNHWTVRQVEIEALKHDDSAPSFR